MKSLAEYLCLKFQKELPHLHFSIGEAEVIEAFNVNGEKLTINSVIECVNVSNHKREMSLDIKCSNKFKRVLEGFEMEDITKIYKVLTLISGNPVGLYRVTHEDAIIVEPEMTIA